jgi:hypothetical protein
MNSPCACQLDLKPSQTLRECLPPANIRGSRRSLGRVLNRFMLFTSMYYTRAEQPSRISAWYLFNGIGVAGGESRLSYTCRSIVFDLFVSAPGGLIGYGIGHIKGALASWRLEFLIVGAVCAAWGIVIALTLANSPLTSRWFNKEEKLMMLARMRRNQTGIEAKRIKWGQVREAVTDYKTVSPASDMKMAGKGSALKSFVTHSGCSSR